MAKILKEQKLVAGQATSHVQNYSNLNSHNQCLMAHSLKRGVAMCTI